MGVNVENKKAITKRWIKEHPVQKAAHDKKYSQTKKGKATRKRAQQTHRQTEKGKTTLHKYNISQKNKENQKRYYKTEKGKTSRKKSRAKHRKLGFTKLFSNPFSDNVEIDWHHIDEEFVVAMPRDLHRLYNWKDLHKGLCMNIVNQIYMDGD